MADLNKLAEDIVGLTLLQAVELKAILKNGQNFTRRLLKAPIKL